MARGGRDRCVADLTPDIREIEIEPGGRPRSRRRPARISKIALTIDGRADTRSYSIVETAATAATASPSSCCRRAAAARPICSALGPGARLDDRRARTITFALAPGAAGISPGRRRHRHHADLVATPARSRARAPISASLYGARRREDFALAPSRGRCRRALATFVGAEGARIDLAAEFVKLAPEGEAYVCGPIRHAGGGQARVARRRPAHSKSCASRRSAPSGSPGRALPFEIENSAPR